MPELNPFIIDVSRYQKNINWAKVKASGVIAVIMKATQGLYLDPMYRSHRAGSGSVGMMQGHYAFGTGDASGTAQADFFLSVVKPGRNDVCVLDWENAKTKRNPFARSMNSQQAVDFVTRIHEKTGRWPMLYSAAWWTIPNLKREHFAILANCPLWLCAVVSQAHIQIPHPWKNWTIWQYTEGEHGLSPRSVPGVPMYCDRDFWAGTEAELRDFWDGDTPTDAQAHSPKEIARLPAQVVEKPPMLLADSQSDDDSDVDSFSAAAPVDDPDDSPGLKAPKPWDDPDPDVPAQPVAAEAVAANQPAVEIKKTEAMSPLAKVGAWFTAAGTTIYGFFSAHSDQVQAVASTQTGTQALAGALATFFHLLPFIIPAALIAGYIGYKEWLAHDRLKAIVATTADPNKQSVVIT